MVDHPSIEKLRNIAELNLCEKCIPVYSSIIAPGVVELTRTYFNDWKDIEWRITSMVMKLEGVYKTGLNIITLDYEESKKYNDEIDYKKFKKIEMDSFKKKIEYLKEKGILQKYSYKLLDVVRVRRNKIHKPFVPFTGSDFIAFSYGAHIVQNIWLSVFGKFDDEMNKKLLKGAEKQAKLYYSKITN
ncbi:MAG: hypothetical protein ACREAK_07075 [Nitrosarchaeum sp.]